MALMYCVKRVQLSLRHSVVDVTPSIWVAIVLSVKQFFIHRYILPCIPASLNLMKIPFLQTLSKAFPDQQRRRSCHCSFVIYRVYLESSV